MKISHRNIEQAIIMEFMNHDTQSILRKVNSTSLKQRLHARGPINDKKQRFEEKP